VNFMHTSEREAMLQVHMEEPRTLVNSSASFHSFCNDSEPTTLQACEKALVILSSTLLKKLFIFP
jgi:hypothetical protein